MLPPEEYLKNPCRSLSMPYRKALLLPQRHDIFILHDEEYDPMAFNGYKDERYFRLLHCLDLIPHPILPKGFTLEIAGLRHIEALSKQINRCYDDISISQERLLNLINSSCYCESLWLMLIQNGHIAASVIGEVDYTLKEGTLEWVQVSAEYRRIGLGRFLVCQALENMLPYCDFATVSGKTDSISHPEALYRSCGFDGSDLWHILHK
ncbi:MAG: hypothetical protein VB078_06185 [Clostridiaceae bacterium]|nr:hypothetical protein [Clostridiaceae bacterium]